MSFNQYLKEALSKNINSIEVNELLEILNNYKEYLIKINKKASLSPFDDEEDKTRHPLKINLAINETKKLEGLKGIPLLIKFIDIMKKYGMFEDSTPFLELSKRYGSDILDVYVRHDHEAPPFIRKGIDL